MHPTLLSEECSRLLFFFPNGRAISPLTLGEERHFVVANIVLPLTAERPLVVLKEGVLVTATILSNQPFNTRHSNPKP